MAPTCSKSSAINNKWFIDTKQEKLCPPYQLNWLLFPSITNLWSIKDWHVADINFCSGEGFIQETPAMKMMERIGNSYPVQWWAVTLLSRGYCTLAMLRVCYLTEYRTAIDFLISDQISMTHLLIKYQPILIFI